jgi:REP element-mobilizing transposase RayT
MSEHLIRRHNKTLLLYHIVLPVRYRREVFTEDVKQTLVNTCKEISLRYEINFLEIGTDLDHVHLLVQALPTDSVSNLVIKIKSLTSKEIFSNNPEVKRKLWGGKFWTSGFYANTVGAYASEAVISKYVRDQGKEYMKLHTDEITFFD